MFGEGGGRILKELGFERIVFGTVFLDSDEKCSELEPIVTIEAGPADLEAATVELGREEEDFTTGLLGLAVCREARGGLGEGEESGGKSGSGGSGGMEPSPAVKRDGNRAEALLEGNQGFAIYLSCVLNVVPMFYQY